MPRMKTIRKNRDRLYHKIGMILVMFGTITLMKSLNKDRIDKTEHHDFTGRQLLQVIEDEDNETGLFAANCTPRSVDQFPPDFMSVEQKQKGGVVFHIVIVIYIFASLAIVCDDYFVASLENICTAMKLQPDVAGATFMAAGSSAPELFTSIVGVFFAKSDVGLGTIVGSAVFNILFIIAICGLFSGMVIHLTWWPLFRDCVFYMISIIALVTVIYDNQVTWYESMVMLLLYLLYIILMYFNPRLGDFMIAKVDSLKTKCKSGKTYKQVNKDDEHLEKTPLLRDNDQTSVKGKNGLDTEPTNHQWRNKDKDGPLSLAQTYQAAGYGSNYGLSHTEVDASRNYSGNSGDSANSHNSVYSDRVGFERSGHALPLHDDHSDSEAEDEYTSPFATPNTIPKKIFWTLMLPVSMIFFITIPDCRRPGCWQKTFVLTFIMSIVWIAVMSYIMVWYVTIIGDTLGIPDTVMGLTFLAAGTSVPDALSSLFVAKDGYGDMAVSNSIGSNVFDILICLGLPWLLQTTAVSPDTPLEITSKGLIFTAIILFGTVVFLVIGLGINGWKLNKKFGVVCIAVYTVVITFSCLYESNVFSFVNLPPCPRLM